MGNQQHLLAIEGTRFFGEMSASVSHEIKNLLAIINENAGLLQDLIAISAGSGKRLDPQRLERIAQSIQRQVTRGDRIVRDLNRFAHSADAEREPVDVVEMIHFILRLGRRLIDIKGVEPIVEAGIQAMTVVTNRFFLENLFWCSLFHVLDECEPGQAIRIGVDMAPPKKYIRYRGLPLESLERIERSFSQQEQMMANFIGIDIGVEDEKQQLCLTFDS